MMSRIRTLWRSLRERERMERDLDDELRFHIESYAQDLILNGTPPEEAMRRARVAFGSTERAAEECRQALGLRLLDELARNLGYAARVLMANPVFAITAIVTLALCIGANTAIYTVVDAVLLRPLPYPLPERLAEVVIYQRGKSYEGNQESLDGRMWEAIRDNATYLDAAVFGGLKGVNYAYGNRSEYVLQQRVSAGFFHVLGVSPLAGREFNRDEDRPGGPPVTVLSYAFWRRVFDGDSSVIGQSIMLRGEPHTIVGVMPAGFRSNGPADLWTPIRPSTTGEGGGTNYGVIARLKPGVSWAQAESQVEAAGVALLKGWASADTFAQTRIIPLKRGLTVEVRTPLLLVWAAVVLVLLIGCVNVAGLLLARAAGRTREIATRMALGGGRAAVIRQFLAEGLLLAACGGAVGIALGYLALYGLRSFGGHTFEFLQSDPLLAALQGVTMDGRVLAATAGMALLTTIVFGVLPAFEATRVDLRTALAEGGTRSIAGGSRRWPRRLLLLAQVAMALVLLVGAGLLIRTLGFLNDLNPGFDATNVITAKLSLDDARYRSPEKVNVLFQRSIERMREIPGVQAVAVGLHVPYERWLNVGMRRLDGPHLDTGGRITDLAYITEDYFRALRIALRLGREFSAADTAGSRPVAIVNQAFVKRYLRDQEPIGSHIRAAGADREIVGIVGDVQQKPSWGDGGTVSPLVNQAQVFIPATQTNAEFLTLTHVWFSPSWIVRSSAPPGTVIAAMQRAVEAVDPTLPFASFRTLDEVRAEALGMHRFITMLLGAMALLALVLASVGIYGLIANSVVERRREMGIRMALGATAAQAIRTAALPGVWLAAAGVLLGCALARLAARVLGSLLYGVRPTDPATFLAVAAGLLCVAAAASFIPALRIARLNPAETLRAE